MPGCLQSTLAAAEQLEHTFIADTVWPAGGSFASILIPSLAAHDGARQQDILLLLAANVCIPAITTVPCRSDNWHLMRLEAMTSPFCCCCCSLPLLPQQPSLWPSLLWPSLSTAPSMLLWPPSRAPWWRLPSQQQHTAGCTAHGRDSKHACGRHQGKCNHLADAQCAAHASSR
jgi:hypothetical protein